MKITLIVIALIVAVAIGARQQDLVTKDLPGCGHFNFTSYSGYLPVDDHNSFHYYFVESENNPKTDPLLIWFTGGPGCSSMLGMFMENGPCVWEGIDNNTTPHPNEFSWNKKANVLYIENPAGVGFNLGYKGEHLDDEIAGDQEMAFVLNWFKQFPEFLPNDLYITGESYGGIYVPYLAYRLHSHNQTTRTGGNINLVGIAVGNGVTDWTVDGTPAYVEMSWYHGLIPRTLKEAIDTNNCQFRDVGEGKLSKACKDAFKEWEKYTDGVNVYDVYKSPQDGGLMKKPSMERMLKGENKQSRGYASFLKSHSEQSPNSMTILVNYMNRADIRQTLHVSNKTDSFQPCVNFNYVQLEKASLWIYPTLKEGGYRILKYSGDTDGAVPTYGTEKWIDKLNWTLKQEHRPWFMNNKVAGFMEIRDGLDYLVFHGVGHLVPMWMREESQFALYTWINNGTFPY